jgi:negative regulator of sigma E activity
MTCQDAVDFVSALCDGERIPREAAEHIGQCDDCRARLQDYAILGAELRRTASLHSPENAPTIEVLLYCGEGSNATS